MKGNGRSVRGEFLQGGFALILLAQLLSCASPAPRPEPPLPSLNPAPAAQEAPTALPEPRPARQEIPPPGPGVPPPLAPPIHTPSAAKPLPPVLPPPKPPERLFHVHTVKWAGETLSAVASWYTGDPKNWKAIAESNPEIHPSRMQEGKKILIPETLVKNREAMPKEFVDRLYAKPRRDKPSPKTQPPEPQQELQLFGPRKSPSR